MIEAVIFDMDGVIFDTEKLIRRCFKKANKVYNINITDEHLLKVRGMNEKAEKEVFEKLFPSISFNDLISSVRAFKNSFIKENGVPIKNGIEDIFKYLKQKKLKIGLATSSIKEIALDYLDKCNFTHYFADIICGDMVVNSKPEPEIYIKSCQNLNVLPKNALVLEDSKNGIISAFKAGCNVLMVIDIEESYKETEDIICGKIKDYKDFMNIFEKLFN